MADVEVLRAFAEKFVQASFRERFVHEARNKPSKLYERICHRIESVFPASLRNRVFALEASEPCWVYLGGDVERTTWQAASRHLGTGAGVLVIAASGKAFVAETEYQRGHPSACYAGTC